MDINNVLLKPVITEKSLSETSKGWFTFLVAMRANKKMIAKAVESQFKVIVKDVRTIIVKGKTKRTGKKRIEITKNPVKKALVKLSKDQKIDLFEMGSK